MQEQGKYLTLAIVAYIAIVVSACSSSTEPETVTTASKTPTPVVNRPVTLIESTVTPEPTASPTVAPSDLLFRYTFAMRMVQTGQYEDAIPQLDIVIRGLPTLAQAYYGRGVAFINQDQQEQGLADLNKAIEIKADYAEAYHERGALFIEQNKTKEGATDLRKALELYEAEDNQEGAAKVKQLLESS